MDWRLALCSCKGFCVVFKRVKLLSSINDMVLRQDAHYMLIAGIGFHYCLEGSVELYHNRCRDELFVQFVGA